MRFFLTTLNALFKAIPPWMVEMFNAFIEEHDYTDAQGLVQRLDAAGYETKLSRNHEIGAFVAHMHHKDPAAPACVTYHSAISYRDAVEQAYKKMRKELGYE